MILILDHYDSFVHNIARYCVELGTAVTVIRHDTLTENDIAAMNPSGIILSPGPCTPKQAGLAMQLLTKNTGYPILGVCLGHQCIGAAFGGVVEQARYPMHVQASAVHHDCQGLFAGLDQPMMVGRYHSLIVTPTPVMTEFLQIDALSEQGEIMALSHRHWPIWGIQFHPESILTLQGYDLLGNFLKKIPAR